MSQCQQGQEGSKLHPVPATAKDITKDLTLASPLTQREKKREKHGTAGKFLKFDKRHKPTD
jgi:hypothetical protein